MNHSIHIDLAVPMIAKGAPVLGVKPMLKGVATGQFLQTMLSTLQAVPESKAVPSKPGDRQPERPMPGGTALQPLQVDMMKDAKTHPAPVAPIHPEVASPSLAVRIPVVVPIKSMLTAKVQTGPLTLTVKGSATTKKSVHKESAAAVPELALVPEAAAPTAAAVPRELPGKPVSEVAVEPQEAIQESSVAVADVLTKRTKNMGAATIGTLKASKIEAEKPDAIVPSSAHPLQGAPAAQNISVGPPVVAHDVSHPVRDVPVQGRGLTAIESLPPPTSHPAVVAKAVGAVAPHADMTSQATDLKTLVATPNVLEVGIASGAHGWLKVRAEYAQTGEVAASVVAGTASAAQSLHKELPGISAYLAGEHVGVSSLVVNSAERGAGAQSSTLNNGTSGTATADGGRSHGGKELPVATARGSSRDADAEMDTSALLSVVGTNLPMVLHANGSGSWLSVRV